MMLSRPRRNRKNEAIRQMVAETIIGKQHLIFPLFLIDGDNKKVEVASMPGIYRYSTDLLLKEIESCLRLGLNTFAIFPSLEDRYKDKLATESYNSEGLYLKALRKISEELPEATMV